LAFLETTITHWDKSAGTCAGDARGACGIGGTELPRREEGVKGGVGFKPHRINFLYVSWFIETNKAKRYIWSKKT